MKIKKECPICGFNELRVISKQKFKSPKGSIEKNKENYDFLRKWILFNKITDNPDEIIIKISFCEKCSFMFSNPRLSEEDVKTKYDNIEKFRIKKPKIFNNPPKAWNYRMNKIYKLVKKFYNLDQKHNPKVLDYGGASGYMLIPFRDKFDCYVLDFEEFPLPKGVKYLGRDFNDIENHEKFDVILFQHTLEHVLGINELLGKIYKFLKEGGIVVIQVPLGCLREWKNLREPLTHINFFSEQSLYNAVKLAGLAPIYVKTRFQSPLSKRNWIIDLIAQKGLKDKEKEVKIEDVASTAFQKNNFLYYLPLMIFNLDSLRSGINRMIRKLFTYIF